MTPPETGTIDVLIRLGPTIAALDIRVFGVGMLVQNRRRAKAEHRRADAEKNRHTGSMEAEKRRAAQAAEDRKVTQGMLAALAELIRRTSPPSSQDGSPGPRPGPAE